MPINIPVPTSPVAGLPRESQHPTIENVKKPTARSGWQWPPTNDHIPINLDPYYISHYRKQGLSIVKTARTIGASTDDWTNRKKGNIEYLIKFGEDALAERLYYKLARHFRLPQQHVFWATWEYLTPQGVAVAIKYEHSAYFPRKINVEEGTVTYRRQKVTIGNCTDFMRHRALHSCCGSGDINQAMIKGGVLFGIDAADCKMRSPQNKKYWTSYILEYKEKEPTVSPIVISMLKEIAFAESLSAIVRQDIANWPFTHQRFNANSYASTIQATQDALKQALHQLELTE